MRTEDFDFNPGDRVMPSDPAELRGKRRDNGRMVVLDRSAEEIQHTEFSRIYDYLDPGDLVVLNDSYILSNTLSFQGDDETADVIVYGHEPDDTTIVRVTGEARLAPGEVLTSIDESRLTCTVLES